MQSSTRHNKKMSKQHSINLSLIATKSSSSSFFNIISVIFRLLQTASLDLTTPNCNGNNDNIQTPIVNMSTLFKSILDTNLVRHPLKWSKLNLIQVGLNTSFCILSRGIYFQFNYVFHKNKYFAGSTWQQIFLNYGKMKSAKSNVGWPHLGRLRPVTFAIQSK